MKKINANYRMLTSCVLMFTVLSVYSLTSYGASDTVKKPAKPTTNSSRTNSTTTAVTSLAPDVPEGVMTLSESGALIISGDVTVNGNLVKSGMTVLSGSTLVVSEHGLAMIDLTPFGRVTLGPNTTAKVTYAGGNLLIEGICDDMRVAVKEGQCNVVAAKSNTAAKVLTAGQDEHFDSAVEVTAKGFVDVVVNCGRDIVCPPAIQIIEPYRFPLFAFFLLGGTAAVVSVGVVLGDPSVVAVPPVSGFQP
jgi:hypothetical protein